MPESLRGRVMIGGAAVLALLVIAYASAMISDAHFTPLAVIALLVIAGVLPQVWMAVGLAAGTAVVFGYIDFSPVLGSRITIRSFPIDSALLVIEFVALVLLVDFFKRSVREKTQLELALARSVRTAEHHRRAAETDPLTGLGNRSFFSRALDEATRGAALRHQLAAVLLIDLTNFAAINESLGNESGDEILRIAARRILSSIRGCDLAARWGSDNFVVLTERFSVRTEAERVVNKVRSAFAHPIRLEKGTVLVGVTVGLAIYPTDAVDERRLMAHAEKDLRRQAALAGNGASEPSAAGYVRTQS